MTKDAYRETQRYIAKLQSIFDFLKSCRCLKIMTCWMESIGNIVPRTLSMSQMINLKGFCEGEAEVGPTSERVRRKFTVDQVGTYSVFAQHEQNHITNDKW